MFNKILANVLFILFTFKAYSMNSEVYIYAVEGDNITLKCESNNTDHWENTNNRSLIIYCEELREYIIPSARLKLTKECNLQIQVLTHDYSSTYRCVIAGESPYSKDFKIIMLRVDPLYKDFTIIMLKPPSKMTVLEAKMTEYVLGFEGQEMTLTCNVNSGEPAETIFWITKEQIVSSGGPGSLNYTFIPQQEDNRQVYTCKANNSLHSVPLEKNVQLRLTYIFVPDDVNCTTCITITDAFNTTDQMHIGNHQGITRREIFLCCVFACTLLVTILVFVRHRHNTTRNVSIIVPQVAHMPTNQSASFVEDIHVYDTADDYSVHMFPLVRNGRMQGEDDDFESNSSISSSMDFNTEEDYIHPYDILVHYSQDDNHEYENLDRSGEYSVSINDDGNDDEKYISSTEIKCSSITQGSVRIKHVDIVKTSSPKEDTFCKNYTKDHHDGHTHIHTTGTNANTQNINQSSNYDMKHPKHHAFDDISLD